ncbi:MAG TPA: CinA family protein [Burkholderiaceae bacterium]|nr:CinA family protein [Burkholderiaceae bacterium]
MDRLLKLAAGIGEKLKVREQTIAVAESSSGGLLSAALLSVPGASAYFIGGAVVYTARARRRLTDIPDRLFVDGTIRSSSEPYALLLAKSTRERFGTDWGLAETGAAGPTGNRYGDAAGHSCLAVAGAGIECARTLETARAERYPNMISFAVAALQLLEEQLDRPQAGANRPSP